MPKGIERPTKFSKKCIVISSRVHPGETGASYMFDGLLKLIME